MNDMHSAVEDYLTMRRALGFKLADHGWLLRDFVRYLERAGATAITTELALRWASGSTGTQTWCAARLSVVRGFARYLHTIDPATEVPPVGLLTYRRHRARPYLYSDADIGRLLRAALDLTPAPRAATYYTMLGLLAVSGMRVGEVLRLDRDDVELSSGLLRVWVSKFGKSREVPVHATTVTMLARYARLRDETYPTPKQPSFFLTTRATRPDITVVHKTFRLLCQRGGLEDPDTPGRPRIHDLRHTLAVRTLLDWYAADVDVQTRLPWLSTYLGHVEPSSTYWYLWAAPELMATAAQRLTTTLGDLP
jgi:integrase/recombinase XerD